MSRVGGLTELYGHQMWSIRNDHNFCMARYEKSFKPLGGENYSLARGGSNFITRGDYKRKVMPIEKPWPMGWRGYVTTTQASDRFSYWKLPAPSYSRHVGLDEARMGDIAVIKIPGRIPMIGFVEHDPHFTVEEKPEDGDEVIGYNWVDISFWDQGKFPTSSESTVSMGLGTPRRIYKKYMPHLYQAEACEKELRALVGKSEQCLNITDNALTSEKCSEYECFPSFIDTSYSHSMLGWDEPGFEYSNRWNQVELYRRVDDVRECPAELVSFDPDDVFSLAATYGWRYRDRKTGEVLEQPKYVVGQPESSSVESNTWAYCVNKGYDAPFFWQPRREYRGAGAGHVTNLMRCGVNYVSGWGSCNAIEGVDGIAETQFFPELPTE